MNPKTKKPPTAVLDRKLAELEERAAAKGIHIHYDRLEAEGLKLKDGICKLDGAVHIFVDRRKSTADKIDILRDLLERPLPDETGGNGVATSS